MRKWESLDDALVFGVSEQFISGMNVKNIAAWASKQLNYQLKREQVYPIIDEARHRHFIRLCPPEDKFLARRISDVFGRFWEDDRSGRIKVAATGIEPTTAHVAATAADMALDQIKSVWQRNDRDPKKPVHVGLGAGWTTRDVALYLANNLQNEREDRPHIVLHAVSPGFSELEPRTAPVSFFNFFHGIDEVTGYRALFATPYVEWDDYDQVKRMHGVRRAFDEKNDIDVLVTAFGSREEGHSELTMFMTNHETHGPESEEVLKAEGWIGDLQYRPYSATKPIEVKTKIRAVTLFELEEFVRFAADPKKTVILVAAPCKICGKSRQDALLPLLQVPSLLVWSHLVIDAVTARRVVDAGLLAQKP